MTTQKQDWKKKLDKKSWIFSITDSNRFIECLNKKIYGMSPGMLRKLKIFYEIKKDNLVYLRLKSKDQLIAGPFEIINKPEGMFLIEQRGCFYKIDYEKSNKDVIPWWIAEGYTWLIFLKSFYNTKIINLKTLISNNIKLPNYGYLVNKDAEKLKEIITKRGAKKNGIYSIT